MVPTWRAKYGFVKIAVQLTGLQTMNVALRVSRRAMASKVSQNDIDEDFEGESFEASTWVETTTTIYHGIMDHGIDP